MSILFADIWQVGRRPRASEEHHLHDLQLSLIYTGLLLDLLKSSELDGIILSHGLSDVIFSLRPSC